jgi:hypothetical protein
VLPTSGQAADCLARSSPRSLRSAVLAVCGIGLLLIGIPFALLMGRDGLVTTGAHRQLAVPTAQLTGCADGKPVADRSVRPGDCIRFTGSGFQPRELIKVTDFRRPGWRSYLRADDAGRFRWSYPLAAGTPAGADVLTFAGTNPADPATVPAVAFCRFTVAQD